jgi:Holliday junction resolvase RusA-like endonuclease
MPFDWGSASADEVRAEARRRADRRAQGLPLTASDPDASLGHVAPHVAHKPKSATLLELAEEVGLLPRRLRLCLPWSMLVSDNARHAPAKNRRGDARIILGREYRHARREGVRLVRSQVGSTPPLTGRCRLTALFIAPNAHVRRDVANYSKLVHDVLTGLVYVDDSQLDWVEWRRGAPDIDRPRLEITVEELG